MNKHAQLAAGALPLRVAIVEDDADFIATLAAAIALAPDLALVASAGSRVGGLQLLREGPPADVLLVDLGLPDGSGIDVIEAAAAQWPGCAVMVSTAFGDEGHVIPSIKAGAAGYLLKHLAPAGLLDEIRSLHAGGSPISPLIARQLLDRFRAAPAVAEAAPPAAAAVPTQSLSPRELEVLQLISRGYTAEEVAGYLTISRHTALTHVRRIYSKLKVNSKAEAIYEAWQSGLLR